jgi:pantoate--beta-alanine ligase
MIIFKKAAELSSYIDNQRVMNKNVGFVPTMGALHAGHLSLVTQSKSRNEITICSIFVNPTQFNNPEDFKKYPITIDNDIKLLEDASCDILFLPSADEIYPANFEKKHYSLGMLEQILEGKHRPGHFQGVCMVVERLLNIVHCDHLYLGKKDYQQCMVLKKLIEITQLKVNIILAETIREQNGLAMSSRNQRLSAAEKEKSLSIHKALNHIKNNLKPGSLNPIIQESKSMLIKSDFLIDYIEITDSNLNAVSNWDGKTTLVALVAATINNIRLIDNMIIA